MIYGLLDHADATKYDLSSLSTVMYGGASIFPSRLQQALERFGNIFLQNFGQTECVSSVAALLKDEHDPIGRPRLLTSCGRPLPATQLEIHGDDDQPVPPGTPGEICVRSAAVISGYWKRPELTEETLRNDWLHTGDVGVIDAEG
jgi:fatty-acyl-CoA synthase